jgi:hypothetical protein
MKADFCPCSLYVKAAEGTARAAAALTYRLQGLRSHHPGQIGETTPLSPATMFFRGLPVDRLCIRNRSNGGDLLLDGIEPIADLAKFPIKKIVAAECTEEDTEHDQTGNRIPVIFARPLEKV